MAGKLQTRANGIPYSSAGLIWRDFGIEILKKLYNTNDSHILFNILRNIDYMLIQPVDKKDNGIEAISPISFVDSYLPLWTDENENYDEAFMQVVNVTKEIVNKMILQEIAEEKANEIISRSLNISKAEKSNILFIPKQTMPWKNIVLKHNSTQEIYNDNNKHIIDFVVFPYPDGGYAAQCVPKTYSDIFSKRIPFPEEWCGELMNLPSISGISDAIFCHVNGFFIRAKTKESIIKLCNKATEIYKMHN